MPNTTRKLKIADAARVGAPEPLGGRMMSRQLMMILADPSSSRQTFPSTVKDRDKDEEADADRHMRSGTSMPSKLRPHCKARPVSWHKARREDRAGSSDFRTGQAS
jgi:hypothetical protein